MVTHVEIGSDGKRERVRRRGEGEKGGLCEGTDRDLWEVWLWCGCGVFVVCTCRVFMVRVWNNSG